MLLFAAVLSVLGGRHGIGMSMEEPSVPALRLWPPPSSSLHGRPFIPFAVSILIHVALAWDTKNSINALSDFITWPKNHL